MTAIISGNSLGLELGFGRKAEQVGINGTLGEASLGQTQERSYVNVANGNLVIQDVDDYVESRGLDISALRTYNSRGLMDDDNGDNWSSGIARINFTGTLGAAGSTLTRTGSDGSVATYNWVAASSRYVSTSPIHPVDSIAFSQGTNQLIWTDAKSGASESYDVKSGNWARIASASDNLGANLVTYSFQDANSSLVAKVTGASGDAIVYVYSGTQLTNVQYLDKSGALANHVSYTYDSSNRLASVTVDLKATDGSGASTYLTKYTYEDASKRLSSISQGVGANGVVTSVNTTVSFGYDTSQRIASVTDGNGKVTRYTYVAGKTTVTDSLNNATSYEFDSSGMLLKITQPPVVVGATAQVTEFTYYASGDLKTVTDPLLRTTTFSYDTSGNLLRSVDAAGNTTSRTYDTVRNLLLTEASYATAGASPTSPMVTRYVYDGTKNLLRYTVSAAGRVTEYSYDDFGQRQFTRTYDAQTFDTSALATDATPTLSSLDTWRAGKSFYLTETRYDYRGQVSSVVQWNASQITNGLPVGIDDTKQSTTWYMRGYNGVLLNTTSANGGQTSYVYDGLERLLSVTQTPGSGSSIVTTTTYNDAANAIVVKSGNGLLTTSTYDRTGHVTSLKQSDKNSVTLSLTRYAYDSEGKLLMTEAQSGDASQTRSFNLYDSTERLVGQVDANGTLTEYVYNAANLVTRTITYSNAVAVSKLVNASGTPLSPLLATLRPAKTPATDLQSWNVYDAANRLVRTIDGRGAVVEIEYDGASRITSTTQRATQLTAAAIAALGDAPTIGAVAVSVSTDDRVASNFYDADGLLRVSYDGEGYATEHRYNAAGQLAQDLRYWDRTTSDASKDALTTYLYDAKGQQVGIVDSEGYLTEKRYDSNGNVLRSIRYSVKPSAAVTASSKLADLLPARDAAAQTTSFEYDKLDRLVSRTDVQGTQTRFTYDSAGNITRTEQAANDSTQNRVTLARFDLQGRKIAELSAQGFNAIANAEAAATSWADWGTSYTYNAAGWRTSATDALGNRTLFFYNVDGLLTHTVNALGEVTETQYNDLEQVRAVLVYDTRLSAATLASLNGGINTSMPALTGTSKKTQYEYDAAGNLGTVTDALLFKKNYAYNAFGQLWTSTEAAGTTDAVKTTVLYDRRGLQKSSAIDETGINAVTLSEYDAFGRLFKLTDANGNTRQTEYDRLGRQVKITNALSKYSSSTYDAFSRTVTTTDELLRTTKYDYDVAARSMTVTTPEGIAVTTSYNRFGQTVSVTDARNSADKTTYEYDRDGNLTRTVGADGLDVSRAAYDHADRLVDTWDGLGNRVGIGYDAVNRVLGRTVDPFVRATSTPGLDYTTRYEWDAQGRQITVTDPEGISTSFTYDAEGQLTKQTVDPGGLNLVTTFTYDGRGNKLTVVQPNANAGTAPGEGTYYTYDTLNRLTLEVVAAGTPPVGFTGRAYEYDKAGNLTRVLDGERRPTLYVYDSGNRLVYTIDGMGSVTENTYNATGLVTRVTRHGTAISLAGLGNAPALRDVARLLTSPATDVIEYRNYDKDGRLTATIDTSGAVVKFTYDNNGNVTDRRAYAIAIDMAKWVEGTEPLMVADDTRDARVRTVYDKLNRATFVADGTGALTQRSYDAAGNVTQIYQYATTIGASQTTPPAVSPDDRLTVFTYDKANRLVYTFDAMRTVVKNEYDANGNVTRRTSFAKLNVLPTTFTTAAITDALGRASSDDRVEQFAYDAANRLTYSIDGEGGVTETVYDASSHVVKTIRRNSTIAPLSVAVDITAAALKLKVDAKADATFDRVERRAYDAANQLRFVVDAQGYATEYQYDLSGRVKATIRRAAALASNLSSVQDFVNALGAIKSDDRAEYQSYDASGQLNTHTDVYGNTQSYTYDALDRKLTFTNEKGDTWNYAYDAAGRLVSEKSPPAPRTVLTKYNGDLAVAAAPANVSIETRMTYDALGNMTSRTEAYGLAEARTTLYSYDALGRQIKTTFAAVGVYNPDKDRLLTSTAESLVRNEVTVSPVTQTLYNAFGDAVKGIDLYGNASYKSYDKAGHVLYEMDAMGYITAYERNAFGETKKLTRYETERPFASEQSTGVSALDMSTRIRTSANDRTISTDYDDNGRAIKVTAPAVFVYDADTGLTSTASQVTNNSYNAFGELTRSFDGNGYTDHFWDNRGLEVLTRDAMGYVTQRDYNKFGELSRLTEYETKSTVPATYSQTLPKPDKGTQDRITDYNYDLLGRKTSEVRRSVDVSTGIAVVGRSTGTLTIGTPASAGKPMITITTPAGSTPRVPGGAFLAGSDGSAVFQWSKPAFYAVASISWRLAGTNVWTSASDLITTNDNIQTLTFDSSTPAGLYEVQLTLKNGASVIALDTFNLAMRGQTAPAPQLAWVNSMGASLAVRNGANVIQGPALAAGYSATLRIRRGTGDWEYLPLVTDGDVQYAVLPPDLAAGGWSVELETKRLTADPIDLTTSFGYDAVGNLVRTTDAMGCNALNYYDALGRVTATITPWVGLASQDGALVPLTEFYRDAVGNVVLTVHKARGILSADEKTYTHPAPGVQADDRTEAVAFDNLGRVTQMTDAMNVSHFVSYDSAGRVAKTWQAITTNGETPDYAVWRVTQYDKLGRVRAIKAPGAAVLLGPVASGITTTAMNYNGFGEMTSRQVDSQEVEYFTYDNAGNLIRTNSGDGVSRINLYDRQGRVTMEVRSPGIVNGAGQVSVDVRSLTLQQAVTTDGLRRTITQYDKNGQAIKQTLPRQTADAATAPTVYRTFDRWGNLLSMTDPRSPAWLTSFTYNDNNQVLTQTQNDSDGKLSVTRFVYDVLGRQLAVTDANNQTNEQGWDLAGNLMNETHADGGTVRYSYNAFNEKTQQRVQQTASVANVIDYSYDKLGRLSGTAYSATTVASVNYTNMTLVVQGAPARYTETYFYDTASRKYKQTNSAGETIRYQYDLSGNVIQSIQGGITTNMAWNNQGKKIAEQDGNLKTATWSYDYFGHMLAHTDIGGEMFKYDYDFAGQLTGQYMTNRTGADKQDLVFNYDMAGNLTTIWDRTLNQYSIYSYDLAGHRLREKTTQQTLVNGAYVQVTYQDNWLAYDALGRLREVADGRASVRIDYDKVGNRTRIQTHVTTPAIGYQTDADQDSDDYFRYDAMNRQILANVNAKGELGIDGHHIDYDYAGNKVSDTWEGSRVTMKPGTTYQMTQYNGETSETIYTYTTPSTYSPSLGTTTERYTNDARGRVTAIDRDGTRVDDRYYDIAGRLVQSGAAAGLSASYAAALNGTNSNGSVLKGNGTEKTANVYDANGRLVHQRVSNSDGTSIKYDLYYTKADNTANYDAAGNLLGYKMDDRQAGHLYSYTYTITPDEGYKQTKIEGKHEGHAELNGTTIQTYDANGFLVSVTDTTQGANNRTFVNDASGKVLYALQGTHAQRQLIVNGEVLGRYGEVVDDKQPRNSDGSPVFTSTATFGFGYEPGAGNTPALPDSVHTVSAGDTLEAIAKQAYGDSRLWYRIADANGMTSNSDLRAGQVLKVPGTATSGNAANTFKPYDPSEVVGDTNPYIKLPPPKKASFWKQLLVVAIVLIVASFTQQWYLTNFATSTSVTFGVVDATVAGATSAATVSTAGMTLGYGAVDAAIAGAVSGAAASAVGQLAGNALGTQNGFSWSQLALSSISGGVGGALGGADILNSNNATSVANRMAQAATGNALAQSIGVATGLQQSFNWRSVAASAAGAGVGQALGRELYGMKAFDGLGDTGAQIARGTVAGMGAGLTSAVMRGGKVSVQQVAVDAFGNALGGVLSETSSIEWFDPDSSASPHQMALNRDAGELGSGSFGISLDSVYLKTDKAKPQLDRDAMERAVAGYQTAFDAELPQLTSIGQAATHLTLTALIGKYAGISEDRVRSIAARNQLNDQLDILDGASNGARSYKDLLQIRSDPAAASGVEVEREIHALNGLDTLVNSAFAIYLAKKYRDNDAVVSIAFHFGQDIPFHLDSDTELTKEAPLGHGASGSNPDYPTIKKMRLAAGQTIAIFEAVGHPMATAQKTEIMRKVDEITRDAISMARSDIAAWNESAVPYQDFQQPMPSEGALTEKYWRYLGGQAAGRFVPDVRLVPLPNILLRGAVTRDQTYQQGQDYLSGAFSNGEVSQILRETNEAIGIVDREYKRFMENAGIPVSPGSGLVTGQKLYDRTPPKIAPPLEQIKGIINQYFPPRNRSHRAS